MPQIKILALPGDGIGPEVLSQALKVFDVLTEKTDLDFLIDKEHFGGAGIDHYGEPLSEKVLSKAKSSDAIFLGAVGGPKWDKIDPSKRPEKGLLALRKELGVFSNIRPARFFDELLAACPLKDERSKGADFVVVRELTGGIYFGQPREVLKDDSEAFNTMRYSEAEIRRIGKVAFEYAQKRRKKLHSVDKANVLEVSRLWRKVMDELAVDYPEVELSHGYVDSVAMRFITHPAEFDVVVTGNLFGDILSDISAALTGSLGMLPSASLGEGPGLYEPIHGSAPDIAGTDKANPFGTILSVAMYLESGLGEIELAGKVRKSVENVLAAGYRTADIAGGIEKTIKLIGCEAAGDLVSQQLNELL